MDGSGGRKYPGDLVINGLPTKAPSSAIRSLPSGIRKPVAVIHVSPRVALLQQLLPLPLTHCIQRLGLYPQLLNPM